MGKQNSYQPITADTRVRSLVVEDDESLRGLLEKILQQRGHDVTTCADAESAWEFHQKNAFPLLILDWGLPGHMDGLQLCQKIRDLEHGHLSVILALTARSRPEDLRKMMSAGADDYLIKPLDPKLLDVRLTIAEHRLRNLLALFEPVKTRSSFQDMIGKSAPMQDAYRRIELAAAGDIPVLLLGESGTGKELAARAVHDLSTRRDRPFLAINCAAIPETLLESELFGHVKGAFTGAFQDRIGMVQTAEGGTLFLDEIGDMPLNLQLKLLRVLEQKEIRRLGDVRPALIDVRLIMATNKDLKRLVESGGMREDFYYRIRGFEIQMPPLRDRREDVPLLVEHFLSEFTGKKRLKGIARDALQKLIDHPWPGNVRHLQHVIEQACVAAGGDRLTQADLPQEVLHPPESVSGHTPPALTQEQQAERLHIIEALKKTGRSRSDASKMLGMSRISLWRKMKKLGVEENDL